MLFTGEYEHTIDSKQRLAIPSEIRAQLEAGDHSRALYVAPGANGSFWLWPERTFTQMAGAMEKSLIQPDELMEFEELVFSQSRRLEIDKVGRVRLPETVLTQMGLEHSVVILGVKDHLELRDPSSWTEERQAMLQKQGEIMLRARRALDQLRHRRASTGGEQDR